MRWRRGTDVNSWRRNKAGDPYRAARLYNDRHDGVAPHLAGSRRWAGGGILRATCRRRAINVYACKRHSMLANAAQAGSFGIRICAHRVPRWFRACAVGVVPPVRRVVQLLPGSLAALPPRIWFVHGSGCVYRLTCLCVDSRAYWFVLHTTATAACRATCARVALWLRRNKTLASALVPLAR